MAGTVLADARYASQVVLLLKIRERFTNRRRTLTDAIFGALFRRSLRIRKMWMDHVAGRANEPYRLWDVLMFQAWLETTDKVRE